MTTDELLEKATKRPWEKIADGSIVYGINDPERYQGKRVAVAVCTDELSPAGGLKFGDERDANAALIVRAVNSFEVMRKALEAASKLLSMVPVDDEMDLEFGKAADDCRAALKLANGEWE